MPQCRGYRYELVHKFPRNVGRSKLWLDAFDNPILNALPFAILKHKSICCRHFRPEDYVHSQSRKLNFVARPSLNLRKLNELGKCRQTEMVKYIKNDNLDLEEDMGREDTTEGNEKLNELSNDFELDETTDFNAESIIVSESREDDTVSSSVDINDVDQAIATDGADNSFKLILNDGFMKIIHAALDIQVEVDVLWLRNICRCCQCIENTSRSFFELPNDLQPVMATVIEEIRKLDIICT